MEEVVHLYGRNHSPLRKKSFTFMEEVVHLYGRSRSPLSLKNLENKGFLDTRNQVGNQVSNQVSNQANYQGEKILLVSLIIYYFFKFKIRVSRYRSKKPA